MLWAQMVLGLQRVLIRIIWTGPTVVRSMIQLIDCPEIDEEILADHCTEVLTNHGERALKNARNNEIGPLTAVLIRHLHVFAAVFPEVRNMDDFNGIVTVFVNAFIVECMLTEYLINEFVLV